MSKELIERLREAALLLTDKAAMDLNAAASVIEIMAADRDALAAELKAVRGDQTPATDDINLQEWKGMDGACAWHLIDRYAEDWHHTERLMNAWLEANREELIAELKALREQEPIGYISPKTSHWLAAHKDSSSSYGAIRIHCSETDSQTVPLYAHPVPARELTDETIQRHWYEDCKDTPQTPGWSRHIRFARAIECYLKGEGE